MRKHQTEMGSLVNSTKTFQEEIIPIPYNHLQEIRARGIIPNLPNEASIIYLNIKIRKKDFTGKGNYRPIFLINLDAKILKKIRKMNPSIKIFIHNQVGFISVMQE